MKTTRQIQNNKRIAFYIGGLCIGGAERVICNLAEYFLSEGYEVYMVTKERFDEEYELSPQITRIIADITDEEVSNSRIGNLTARIKKLTNLWREIKPDVIVSFIRKNNLMAIASARPLKIPVIVSVRSAPARELQGKGFKELSFAMFSQAAGVVLQTNEAKAFFPAFIQKKAIVLPNSINPSFLSVKKELDTSSNVVKQKQVISVGRIDGNKNQRLLVDAYARIAENHPDWTLHIYGDGEGRKALEDRIADVEFEDRIILHGAVQDVPKRMKEASIFVLPSNVEGMPNALIEAMVMGLAVISTDCPSGGPRDLIDGHNGVLVPVGDVHRLADELDRLIYDEELRIEMGTEASRIIERVHPDAVNALWKNYIEKIAYGF